MKTVFRVARDKDENQPIPIHGESPGRKVLRCGCLVVLAVFALLAAIAVVFWPLRGLFRTLMFGPGPM
jgi:hypothetical protein